MAPDGGCGRGAAGDVGATAAAQKGFTAPVVLIAGGDGKGQDFTPLRAAEGDGFRCPACAARKRRAAAEAKAEVGATGTTGTTGAEADGPGVVVEQVDATHRLAIAHGQMALEALSVLAPGPARTALAALVTKVLNRDV